MISQDSAATFVRCGHCGGIFNDEFIANVKFSMESAGERVFKIRQYLMQICTRLWRLIFSSDSQYNYFYSSCAILSYRISIGEYMTSVQEVAYMYIDDQRCRSIVRRS